MKKLLIIFAVLAVVFAMYLYVRSNSDITPVKTDGTFVKKCVKELSYGYFKERI